MSKLTSGKDSSFLTCNIDDYSFGVFLRAVELEVN